MNEKLSDISLPLLLYFCHYCLCFNVQMDLG